MQVASSSLRESWQYDTEIKRLVFVWKKKNSTQQEVQKHGHACPMQQIRIFSCYYEHDPRLFA